MELSADEIAGVASMFGGLTREELAAALAELAYKRDGAHDPAEFEAAIDRAVESYHLVAADSGDGPAEPVFVPGPVAFPDPPTGAEDLPHILDVPERSVDRDVAARAAANRLLAEAATAVDNGDDSRVTELIDVSYELEAWGDVDVASARERLLAFEHRE